MSRFSRTYMTKHVFFLYECDVRVFLYKQIDTCFCSRLCLKVQWFDSYLINRGCFTSVLIQMVQRVCGSEKVKHDCHWRYLINTHTHNTTHSQLSASWESQRCLSFPAACLHSSLSENRKHPQTLNSLLQSEHLSAASVHPSRYTKGGQS